jgi:hypothetical protein
MSMISSVSLLIYELLEFPVDGPRGFQAKYPGMSHR